MSTRSELSAQTDRVNPFSPEEERAVLGAMLKDSTARDLAIAKLRPEDFYVSAHRIIFKRMLKIFEETGGPADMPMLYDRLSEAGELEKVGGPDFVTDLTEGVTPAHAQFHIKKIREKSYFRALIAKCQWAIHTIQEANGAAGRTLADHVSSGIVDALEMPDIFGGTASDMKSMMEAIAMSWESYADGERPILGIESGYKDLDLLLKGFEPGKLYVIAGRPSMGKTTFLLNLLREISITQRRPGMFFSLESSRDAMSMKLLSAFTRVKTRALQEYMMRKEELEKANLAVGTLMDVPLIIDEAADIGIYDIRSRARKEHAKRRLEIVAVDYLQLIRKSGRKFERRDIEVGDYTAKLLALAKELQVPVIVLSQLNRGVESREGHRPRLSDLRESGAIEQDAHAVMFVHRPGYYSKEGKTDPRTEIIVEKNRDGRAGELTLYFDFECGRFDAYSPKDG